MSNYLEGDTFSQTGAWLTTTARRNPEALLLLAAGCVLLMRSGGSSSFRTPTRRQYSDAYQGYELVHLIDRLRPKSPAKQVMQFPVPARPPANMHQT